ncbi:hypothetical protein GCM10017083_02970 [Thalassobaculum fulvum]|jgi:hypothetical protein|uniref:DUF3501 domain-containing protein n=1 Tax=Thalassobaculum fulvum TaxID=1633335 RepID=A0A918XMT7_9PROT|nr:DUF3501 family protein [Thalassobaculum fulvum]GHD40077.1 hypothetical protein GCM10017083_02970 [Thalassobaculum fulvum]
MAKEITRADIMDMAEYAKVRAEKRRALVDVKRNRRVPLGPHATFYFENYETMWQQIHEMLFIERGGEAQIPDELEAYNPLIPNGRELVATLMFEIDNPVVRKNVLSKLGGVEETGFMRFAGHEIVAKAEEDVDRTTADGKASSVQFLHFNFSDEQAKAFAAPGTEVVLGLKHPGYAHMTILPEAVREALSKDFD